MSNYYKRDFDILKKINYHIKKSADKKAIIFTEKISKEKVKYNSISFRQLDIYSNQLANYFKENGIQPKDKVIVMIPVSLMLYTVIFALIKIGAVVVFIDPWIGIKKIKECVKLTKPKGFIGNLKANVLRALSNDIRKIPFKLTISNNDLSSLDYFDKFNTKKDLDLSIYRPEDTMFIRFTTGSTGKPKGVDRSYEYICNLFSAISDFFFIKKDDVDLTTYPLNIFYDLVMGATVVIPLVSYGRADNFKPEVFVNQFKENNVTTASGSPFFWNKFVNYCLENNIKFNNLRFIFTGGGPVSLNLLKKFKSVFFKAEIFVAYGSTEVFPISWININDIIHSSLKDTVNGKGICLGKIHPKLDVKIIDTINKSKKLDEFEIGEIIVSGPHVNKNYYADSGELFNLNKIVDKKIVWHKTGDAGYFDDKKRLWLVGRSQDIYFRNDKKICPLMVEYIANSFDEVLKSGLIKDENDKLLLIIELCKKNIINTNRQKKILEEKIRDKIKQRVIDIDRIIFVKAIPVDTRHQTKIDYNLLKKKYRRFINA